MIEYNVKVYDDGDKEWYLNGNLHREDGPAIEYDNGDKYWYLNGKLHREDGPACEYSDEYSDDGDKEWYLNGKLHREDGPAIEYDDGEKHWYLNGEELTKKEFKNKIKKKKKIIIDGKEIEISRND
jgi:N-acetylneuraminic acid mutarotase